LDHGFYLTISTGLAWVLASVDKIKSKPFFTLVLLGSVAVYFTYTRTVYIAHTLMLLIIGISFVRRRIGIVTLILITGLIAGLAVSSIDLNNIAQTISNLVNSRSLLNLQTMESRYGSWAYYQDMMSGRPLILLGGAGLVQSAFPFMKIQPPLIDNMYLSLILYGGSFFLISYLVYLFYYFQFFARRILRQGTSAFNTRLVVVLCSSVAITILVGFSATVWDLLSIGLPVSVLWAISWSYFRVSELEKLNQRAVTAQADVTVDRKEDLDIWPIGKKIQ
jgi:hypothetical protein